MMNIARRAFSNAGSMALTSYSKSRSASTRWVVETASPLY
jgi:hypothetical protein